MTDDRQKFIDQIVTEPRDTTLRGVFADWLDEHDDPQWAELIRSGKEIDLGVPGGALFYLDGTTVLFQLPPGVSGVVRNGFVDEVSANFGTLFGRQCPACNGRGTLCRDCNPNEFDRIPGRRHPGAGLVGGCAADLFKRFPITRVQLDMPIYWSGGNMTCYVGGLGSFPQRYWQRLEDHLSERTARDALSDCAVDLGRALAALSPLES